ncbi:hypothetical protein DOY81_006914 [Sarcophaga bullata]|nr:hypothetical protein DOY81_006914 [Sarcophaga bullata]
MKSCVINCLIYQQSNMLKWAVNGPRQAYSQNENNELELPTAAGTSSLQQKRHLKRKSSDLCTLRTTTSRHGNENQYTSTPLHTSLRSFRESPSRKMDSLKDLSNIIPENSQNSSLRFSLKKNRSNTSKTPERVVAGINVPNNYATTLPTFDVEYSPCALIPGSLIALRGVGIPDSYFEKPRYITPLSKKNVTGPGENCTHNIKTPNENPSKCPIFMEESTLSSTKMGDETLERMIDAILQSNRKERKPLKAQKPPQQQDKMSPTYTPAEDPASDLQEVWDTETARYRQKEQKFRARLTKKTLFREREVCTPQSTLNPELRRQGGLRRKRKITQITTSVMSSAQKLLSKASQVQTPLLHSHDKTHPRKLMRNLSPDSGHNSSSEYEENEIDSTLQLITDDNKTLDNTKRKLSFSIQNLNRT